ncbi:MAG: TrkH family potassium uptake protein [Acholeplasmatales bacterium]|nr:TrkH family potassium uptake protein [Acholeplasmatales bacterium]
MNYRIVRNLIGKMLILVAALMVVPLVTAFIYKESIRNIISYLIPMVSLALIGALMAFIGRAKDQRMGAREGFVIVALSWLLMSLFGCLPFLISGYVTDFFTAFFEMASGFTTTGASALTVNEMDQMLNYGGRSLMMWRSFSHWIGGMGILVFILAVIPESKEGSSVHILRAESPGPQVGKIVSRMRASSRILYLIYIFLTLLEVCILNLCHIWDPNMTFYDSLIMSFGTAGTGGFALTPASAGLYAAPSQYVIATFMIIFGVNFTIYYWLLIRNFKDIFQNEEIKCYFLMVTLAVVVITLQIYKLYSSFEEGFRHAYFQVASIISTTGYSTTDYWSGAQGRWPALSLGIIVFLMFCGSCAGSTAGGMKQSRIIILSKYSGSKIKQMISPRKVEVIRMDGKPVEENVIQSTLAFFIVYIIVLFVCALLISIWNPMMPKEDQEPLTMITASLSCISNIGPGLGAVGPAGGFSNFSWLSKLILTFEMIAGRLELFPILILFTPRTWKRRV